MRQPLIRNIIRMMSDSVPANKSIEGPIAKAISSKINGNFNELTKFEIYNDSYKHAGHHGMSESDNVTESHFRIELVTDEFKGIPLPKRHRIIFDLLSNEMDKIHALQIKARSQDEEARILAKSK
ncbi:hypothetical protein Kpol_1049p3 [Vanderwaltozyma polyspora DSM 70294]|uniref:BolA protein n=1 Tax=Vanderwaltozyma polyspora (strain ATCC 22028 / DSM 70294 / BCRC 21397 / CBS 2163 / NBRC 10782 / NRRL Y-8283 / UCD 57-17) TaxID=436907 RepID=A7TPP4_VANPO|nr:uncharacterized protein Kpol_1049p3 [Vanderwaltozyma polyspora DSM 70294]EDO15746.1 hypothetical protein Kpol_1049p3 [Vanderwaltozyma polyspora DSM 70294]